MIPFNIKWQAPEFEYHPKSPVWYWGTVIVALGLIASAFWMRDFLFGVFIIIAEILILIWSSKEPRDINFTLTERGLNIENHKMYYVRDIESFTGFEDWSEEWSTIVLDIKGHIKPSIHVHIPRERFAEIESAMASMLPMKNDDPSFLDTLERYLGF